MRCQSTSGTAEPKQPLCFTWHFGASLAGSRSSFVWIEWSTFSQYFGRLLQQLLGIVARTRHYNTVITCLRRRFARYGRPMKFMLDDGPQFSARPFKLFAMQWQIQNVTSSPNYPAFHGKAESAVKWPSLSSARLGKTEKTHGLRFLASISDTWRGNNLVAGRVV